MEIMFPVEKPALREKLIHILSMQMKDTVKAHVLLPNGRYQKVDKRGKEIINAQQEFCKEAVRAAKQKDEVVSNRVFIPETHHE